MRTAALMALLFSIALAAPAHAATFHVYGLGLNGASCDGGAWQALNFAPTRINQHNLCDQWHIGSVPNVTLANGDVAGASMHAGAGAHFSGFAIKSSGRAYNGAVWEIAGCASTQSCSGFFPQSGTWSTTGFGLGTLGLGGDLNASFLFFRLRCASAAGCAPGAGDNRAGLVINSESDAIVDDPSPPSPAALAGVSTGWSSGERTLTWTASDPGSGVSAAALTIDGSLSQSQTLGCARLPTGGYTRPVPCATAAEGSFRLNRPGQLADGRHVLTLETADAGGAVSSTGQEFWVDNNAPGHVHDLRVEGGNGWRSSNDYSVTWVNPDQGTGSSVVAAYYKIGSAPTTPTDGVRVAGNGIARLRDLQVPGDGEWTIYVWTQDEAGNVKPGNAVTSTLRLDTIPPHLSFNPTRNPHDPAEIRALAEDKTSGVAGGVIEICRRGIDTWQPLETRLEGGELVTVVPDERLERGTYELRAAAWDAVGNRAESTARSDGQQMTLDLPLRSDSFVSAALARRAEGSRRDRGVIRIGYRRAVWLRGLLHSSAGGPLSDTRLRVQTRPPSGGEWQPFAETVTDAQGRYKLRIPPGPSRELLVSFPGTRALRPTQELARLLVSGRSTLRLEPRRLRRGGVLTFRGRVGQLGAALPPGGKLVQIQFLDGRSWRPAVKLGRTDARGRFRIRYRFRRISRPTRIHFRILIPAESGWPYLTGASPVRTVHVFP